MTTATISTGSDAIDSLLGGGVHRGMITDVYGESGSGKSQLCFTLCANCAKQGATTLFIDTAGTFRPERVMEISSSQEVLEKITYIRALTTIDQKNATKKILGIEPTLVVVDTLTSLFSIEYSGPARHLAMMNYLHKLALLAIKSGCAVVVSNVVRTAPKTLMDQAGRNIAQAVVPSQQREYLGSSVSIYSHMKIKLEILDSLKSSFQAVLVQPAGKGSVPFAIKAEGISDWH
jgi:RecA/RadA recombinase